jgi:hypothetical protein
MRQEKKQRKGIAKTSARLGFPTLDLTLKDRPTMVQNRRQFHDVQVYLQFLAENNCLQNFEFV